MSYERQLLVPPVVVTRIAAQRIGTDSEVKRELSAPGLGDRTVSEPGQRRENERLSTRIDKPRSVIHHD